jgi:tetratricopeptide (TPR) repeat protein
MIENGESSAPEDQRSGPKRPFERRAAFELVQGRLFASLAEPVTLDRFVVTERLGQGGMGVVYAAFDPRSDRNVALKVVRPGCAGLQARARLQREARTAAALAHPNVVTVYESGVGEDGELFIAMELVTGPTLRQWLEERPRPWPAVVRMMIATGEGLAAAHMAGLVHRDFKPDNVLIGLDGRPRVADFGLARPAEASEPEDGRMPSTRESNPTNESPAKSSLTRTGALVGTLAYLPLEQLRGRKADARSDQFGFCVSLYEALYGERPFEGDSIPTLMRALQLRVRRPGSKGKNVPESLREVVLRGLATAPEDRWPSMEALLLELRRQVPHTSRRWIWPGLGLGVAGGSAAIGLSLATTEVPGPRCDDAQAQMQGVWEDARRSEVKAAVLATGLSYASDTWERVEPALDAYAQAWASKYTEVCEASNVPQEQALVAVDLRMACLRSHRVALRESVGVLARADETTVERAVALVASLPELARCDDTDALQAELPPPHAQEREQVEDLRQLLVRAHSLTEAGNYDESAVIIEQVTERAQALGYAPLVAEALLRRGRARERQGRYSDAERDLEQAYLLATEHGHDPVRADAAVGLTSVVGSRQARYEQGRHWGKAALSLAATASLDRDVEVRTLLAVGKLLSALGEHDDALDHYRRALALAEAELGPEHPRVAATLMGIGAVLQGQGKLEEALEHQQRALALVEAAQGPGHPRTATALINLGDVLVIQGKLGEALGHLQRALAIREQALGPMHPDVATTLNEIGDVLAWQGKPDQAFVHHERALAILVPALGPEHPDVATTRHYLGAALLDQKRLDEALEQYRRCLAIREEALGPLHPSVADSLMEVGMVLGGLGQPAEALEHLQRALAITEQALGHRHPNVGNVAHHIAGVLRKQGELEASHEYALRALELWEEALGPEHPRLVYPLIGLANAELDMKDFNAARPHAERAVSIMESGEVSTELTAARFALAQALWPDRSQRPRALALAELARDAYAGAEADPAALAHVEAWLRRIGSKQRNGRP